MKILSTLFLSVICLLSCVEMRAENIAIGTWTHYPAYSPHEQQVVETPSGLIYYLSGGSLFSYDIRNDESYSYSLENKLNDSYINGIFYDPDRRFLLLAYDTGNIDVLYDNGRVVNVSDILDSNLNISKNINHVSFGKGRIYVSTDFGVVVFNADRMEVIESGIYEKKVSATIRVGDYLLLQTDRQFYAMPASKSVHSWDNWSMISNCSPLYEIVALGDDAVVTRSDDNAMSYFRFDFPQNALVYYRTFSPWHRRSNILSYSDNHVCYAADGAVYSASPNENRNFIEEVKLFDLPDELAEAVLGSSSPEKSLWSINREGLAHHTVSGAGQQFMLAMDRFRPEDFSVKKAYYFYPSADSRYLYVRNLGSTSYKFGHRGERGVNNIFAGSRIELATGEKTDITLYPFENRYNTSEYSKLGLYANCITSFAPDPDDPDTYYLSSVEDGVLKVKNGKLAGRFDDTNSLLRKFDNRFIAYGVNIDRAGNLWIATFHENYTRQAFMVLPAAKRNLDPSKIKPEDWINPPKFKELEYWGGQDVEFLNCRHSDMMFIIDSDRSNQIACMDTRGTYSNFNDDRFYVGPKMTDQDGNIVETMRQVSLLEDHNGKVWFGTDRGVFEISRPADSTNPKYVISHLKVPRNDGTNQADYLLGTDMINCMAVDAANRKWIGTDVSGLYLVSPEGDEIIERFHVDNSPLKSNRITALYCDPNSSILYIGTENGLYTYATNAMPAADNFDDIYAFPNPVRHDYTGPVYVRGLMDGSLVRIADSSGNVVNTGRSEGGLYTWNGCNMYGRRVPTGVYYVFASTGPDAGTSDGAVTKILVVN